MDELWSQAKLWHKAYGRALLDKAHEEKEGARAAKAAEKRMAKAAEKAKAQVRCAI